MENRVGFSAEGSSGKSLCPCWSTARHSTKVLLIVVLTLFGVSSVGLMAGLTTNHLQETTTTETPFRFHDLRVTTPVGNDSTGRTTIVLTTVHHEGTDKPLTDSQTSSLTVGESSLPNNTKPSDTTTSMVTLWPTQQESSTMPEPSPTTLAESSTTTLTTTMLTAERTSTTARSTTSTRPWTPSTSSFIYTTTPEDICGRFQMLEYGDPEKYFVTFPPHYLNCTDFFVFVTAQQSDVTFKLTDALKNYEVTQHTVAAYGSVELYFGINYALNNGLERKGVMIETDRKISVHVEAVCTGTAFSTYSYNVLPLSLLDAGSNVGHGHQVGNPEYSFSLVILATQYLGFVVYSYNGLFGEEFVTSAYLNRLETYTIQSVANVASFRLTSSKPVALYLSYSQYSVEDYGSFDGSVYQIAPVLRGYQEYFFPPTRDFEGNTMMHAINIFSWPNGNTVWVYLGDELYIREDDQSQYIHFEVKEEVYITCDKPCFIEVSFYSNSEYFDPESMQMMPVCDMMVGTFQFTVESLNSTQEDIWNFLFAKIVLVASSEDSLFLDYNLISENWASAFRLDLVFTEIDIEFGIHNLRCNLPCTAYLLTGGYHTGNLRQIPQILSEVEN